jgi:hypothetical protein
MTRDRQRQKDRDEETVREEGRREEESCSSKGVRE